MTSTPSALPGSTSRRRSAGQAASSLDVTAGKQADRGALEGDRLFRVLLESAPDAMVIVDEEGQIQLANAETERLFGYGRDELIGHPVEMLIPHRYRERHIKHRHRFFAQPSSRPMGTGTELSGLRKDRTEFAVEISLSPLHTEAGLLATAAIRDVTERKQTETTVARLASIVSSLQEAVIAKTLDGMITDWNPAAERLYGYCQEEALGMPISELLSSEDQQGELAEILERVRAGQAIEKLETTRRAKDGHLVEVELTIAPIHDPNGRIVGAASAARDISERKRAEELLRRSHERLEQAELIAQMGTWEWDLLADRVSRSAGLYSIFRLNRDAFDDTVDIEDALRQRVHPEDHELIRQALRRVLTELTSISIEYRAVRSDGRIRILEWHAEPIVDDTGSPIRIIAVIHDITETRHRQQALNAASSNLAKYAQELQRLADASVDPPPAAALTAKQLQILQLLAEGLTNAQIGKRMFLSEAAVKWNVSQILSKSNSTNRTEAVARLLGTALSDEGRAEMHRLRHTN
jgi:PAS domain S-box-containing protein